MDILKEFSDSSIVYYDEGNFDNYCVYIKDKNSDRIAPTDVMYFQYFKDISLNYGKEKIYNDFCSIYNKTTKDLSNDVLSYITELSYTYNSEDTLQVDKWFTVIYLGMIAEERKANTRLGKKIKRLGFHQAIIDDFTAECAGNFSRNKKAYVILNECEKRGF